MEQLALKFQAPRRKRAKDTFVSNQETGLYFWCHSDETRVYNFSNRPHELLPHHCDEHEWWSDVPCRAEHRREKGRAA